MGTPKSPITRRICEGRDRAQRPPAPHSPSCPNYPPLPIPSSLWPASPRTRPGKNRLFLNFRKKKAMKKVPAMSTNDSRAVLGWPWGLSTPACSAELVLPCPGVGAASVHVVFLPPSASELLEAKQPWRGCSWKIWGKKDQTGPYELDCRNVHSWAQLDAGGWASRGQASLP